MKQRLRKARRLIKKFNDSWGSLDYKFRQRVIGKRLLRVKTKEEV